MSLTTKPVLTRAERRVILRAMLRDPNKTVWDDTVLNICLDEALTFVQGRYPLHKVTTFTVGSYTMFALPAETLRVLGVYAAAAGNAGTSYDELAATDAAALQGLVVAGGAWSVAASLAQRTLVLQDYVAPGSTLIVVYLAAQQPWGTPADVSTGRDSVAIDLNPAALTDGLAGLLFYACARAAAYRYGRQLMNADGGRDFEAELQIALKERAELLELTGQNRPLRAVSALF